MIPLPLRDTFPSVPSVCEIERDGELWPFLCRSIHLYTAGVASGRAEPLTPELAVRLNAYLQSHPARSVLYQKDTREWIFTDDDPDGELTAIPDSELGRYLSEFSGRASR